MLQDETANEFEQIQKSDEIGKFAGLEFLEQKRLKSVEDLEAMLEMDEKENPPSLARKTDKKNSL